MVESKDQKNCIFICIDCLRRDIFEKTSAKIPFLKKFSSSSTYFSNMHSTATTTTPSVASFFTGTYPPKHGIESLKDILNPHITTLAEKFKSIGYKTYALTSGPLIEETGLNKGFDIFQTRRGDETIFTSRYSELLNYINKLVDKREKIFLFLHLWALHKPLNIPEKFNCNHYGLTSYERALSVLDVKLKRIIEKFSDNSCLVICGDHGESIISRDLAFFPILNAFVKYFKLDLNIDIRKLQSLIDTFYLHYNPRLKDHLTIEFHGDHIYDFLTNIPFLLKDKRLKNRVINKQVRQVDIFPTLLKLFKIPYSPTRIDGKKLIPLKEVTDRTAYLTACGMTLRDKRNRIEGIRTPEWKLVTYPYKNWSDELYNLKDDEFELFNKAYKNKKVTRSLREKLSAFKKKITRGNK